MGFFAGYMCFLGFSALVRGLVFTWFRAVFAWVLNVFAMDFSRVFLYCFSMFFLGNLGYGADSEVAGRGCGRERRNI